MNSAATCLREVHKPGGRWLAARARVRSVEAWNAPWKLHNEVARLAALPAIRLQFAWAGVRWGQDWRIFGMPILQRYRGSTISLGPRLELRSTPRSNPLTPFHPVVLSTRGAGAVIDVGADCGMTGAVLVAAERITLGSRVILGANVVVLDTDFHSLDPERRKQRVDAGAHARVQIDDDVFVGTQAMILKGVHIGRGAVIGAGSVVTRDVAAGAIVGGNPARVVGRVSSWEVSALAARGRL